MTNLEFVQKLKDIANNYKTLYIMGCFGAPMIAKNRTRYSTNHSYNKQASRTKMIQAATPDTFGFDCVGLIKGVLWGWSGKKDWTYGGAVYASNNVPDIGADTMITKCSGLSTNFSKIEVGEAVWTQGHIGVYIGDGLAVECTPSWKNCVQITACNCDKKGYKRRNWTKHGKLPYLEYKKATTTTTTTATTTSKACKVELKQLKKGDKGNEVKALQMLLEGYDLPLGSPGAEGVDGDFGSYTEKAVKSFQKNRKLTQDGIVGVDTWSCLLGLK